VAVSVSEGRDLMLAALLLPLLGPFAAAFFGAEPARHAVEGAHPVGSSQSTVLPYERASLRAPLAAPGATPPTVTAPAVAAPAAEVRLDRVYALVRLNGRAVPAEVEFATTAGSRHWLRMEEAILRLRRDGTFVASARFYRELLQADHSAPARNRLRLLSDGATGRYTIRGDTLALNVAKRKDTAASTVHGRIAGDRVRIRHTLRDGTFRHAVDVELKVDPTIW
jgi:hypothetical protein